MANAEIINRKDPLTGFHTKDGLNEYLETRLSAVYDKSKGLSVIILDLDNFKGINDTHGHLVGDDALRFFAMIINTVLKGQHFVARYGGDEFVIAMNDDPDGRGSIDVGNRIKGALKKEKFTIPTGSMRINTSIGIASYPRDAKGVRTLLETADQALYYAKKHGKNKVVSSRTLRAHSIQDRLILLVKLLVIAAFIWVGYFAYKGTKSSNGVMLYYQNIYRYVQYNMHASSYKYNFCYIELKNGKRMQGWIIKEDKEMVYLSVKEPVLRLNPASLDYLVSIEPVKIPKAMIQSSIKNKK